MNKQKQIKKLYGVCSDDYDRHMDKTNHYKAQENILKLLLGQIEEPILDLACGTGFLLRKLSNKFTKVFGNDFSPSMVKLAKKNSKFKITNDNAETLESYSIKMKTIILCNLFFYIQDRNKAIKRWKEMLQKGGKIIFIEEHPFLKPKKGEMDEFTKKLTKLINPISPDEIIRLMSQKGFTIIQKEKVKIDDKHSLYGLVFSLK